MDLDHEIVTSSTPSTTPTSSQSHSPRAGSINEVETENEEVDLKMEMPMTAPLETEEQQPEKFEDVPLTDHPIRTESPPGSIGGGYGNEVISAFSVTDPSTAADQHQQHQASDLISWLNIPNGNGEEFPDEKGMLKELQYALNGSRNQDAKVKENETDLEKHLDGSNVTQRFAKAAEDGNVRLIQEMIENGIDVNQKDDLFFGKTAIMSAAEKCHLEIVETLLANTADVNLTDEDGWTALHWAADGGNQKIVQQLLASGAEVNATENRKETPLYRAAMRNNVEVISPLINADADPNIADIFQNTPVHTAVLRNHLDIAEILLKTKKFDVNLKNKGETVFHLGAQQQKPNKFQYLRLASRLSFDFATLNEAGKTVFDEAILSHYPREMFDLLGVDNFVSARPRFVRYDDLQNVSEISSCSSGSVYKAVMALECPNARNETVLVPVICRVSSERSGPQKGWFWQQAMMLQNLPFHRNVNGLLALCNGFTLEGIKQTAFVTSYKHGGTLLKHLEAREADKRVPLDLLIHFGVDMTRAVQHFHLNGYKHCDIAARNFLLTKQQKTDEFLPGQTVSISNFNLSRPEKSQHPHDTKFPVLWCSPETLQTGQTTFSSDTWMLGIAFYELCVVPYLKPYSFPAEKTPQTKEELIARLESDKHFLLFPYRHLVPNQWLFLLKDICQLEPKDRPDLDQIIFELQQLKGSQGDYISPEHEMDAVEGKDIDVDGRENSQDQGTENSERENSDENSYKDMKLQVVTTESDIFSLLARQSESPKEGYAVPEQVFEFEHVGCHIQSEDDGNYYHIHEQSEIEEKDIETLLQRISDLTETNYDLTVLKESLEQKSLRLATELADFQQHEPEELRIKRRISFAQKLRGWRRREKHTD